MQNQESRNFELDIVMALLQMLLTQKRINKATYTAVVHKYIETAEKEAV